MEKEPEKKTHWKKLVNPDYLGAYSLNPGEEKVLTIAKVVRETVKGSGGKKQECTVLHFVEKEKPMIVNRLNSKIITKIYGTPYIEDWIGKKIKIYADMVEAFGDMVEALRIRSEAPKLPELTPDHPKWKDAYDYIQKGNSIDDILKRYSVSDDNQKLLLKP